MSSLQDQLNKVSLKTAKEPIRDYSQPKTSGYTSQQEVHNYQNTVLDSNIEKWLDILKDETFPSLYCPIEYHEAELFIKIYKKCFDNVDSSSVCDVNWRNELSEADKKTIDLMTDRLEKVMKTFTASDGYVFVKTSSRSAKDAPVVQKQFKDLYLKYLAQNSVEDRSVENTQVTCLLQAGFESLRVKFASDVIDMFVRSERIYQDMLLAVEIKDRFHENFVVRKFVDIEVDMEFRGFVYGNKLRALCQYNYLIYSPRLIELKEKIGKTIEEFFNTTVKHKLEVSEFPDNYIIDFAVCEDGKKVWVIEINPFLDTTDGAMFSWGSEQDILEKSKSMNFRIVTRPKPGAKAMLPQSVKSILESGSCLE